MAVGALLHSRVAVITGLQYDEAPAPAYKTHALLHSRVAGFQLLCDEAPAPAHRTPAEAHDTKQGGTVRATSNVWCTWAPTNRLLT